MRTTRSTMNGRPTRSFPPLHSHLPTAMWLFTLITMSLLSGRVVRAQGVASRFPSADQVAKDFPDEPERYVALNLLWDVSHEKAPDAREMRSAYYRAAE